MISSFYSSLLRVTAFWYVLGLLVLFIGPPDWADARYIGLASLPWVPEIELDGINTAASVQWTLVGYWTLPVLLLWGVSTLLGAGITEIRYRLAVYERSSRLKPQGEFWGVTINSRSLGSLPAATTPRLTGQKVSFAGPGLLKPKGVRVVNVEGPMKEALKMLTPAERQLCEELLQLLMTAPNHYAGLGHGVGLLEHTLNVVVEAAPKCTPEFRLPLVAALAHDVGKLITFQSDGNGGWVRKGLHSREGARILATLPGFQELPEMHQRGLILAIKYDHAPNKMPELRGDKDASMLGLRIISALASADRTATAAEKDRNLEKLKPEDLLWKDFVDFLRQAPVVQRGKKGVANQVNNPPDSPFLFIYEGTWREEAVRRLPAEVAAALDLNRRDTGKIAKYTRILAECLRKEGLLVEEYEVAKDGGVSTVRTSENNPLWDIQSGSGEKAVVMRGIMVLRADELWKKVNFRLSVKSPFPVTILAPNADADGRVNHAPQANRSGTGSVPEVSDGIKLSDVQSPEAMAAVGLDAPSSDQAAGTSKPKARRRSGFQDAVPDQQQDALFGLAPAKPAHAASDEKPNSTPQVLAAEPVNASTDALDGSTASALDFLQSSSAAGVVVAAAPWDEPTPAKTMEPAPAQSSVSPVKAPQGGVDAPRPVVETPPAAPTAAPIELSRAEKREGIALADEAAMALYPGLALGDKYYTEQSGAVQAGLRKPGSKYKGDTRDKKFELSEEGPRRRVRRTT